jgi:hypothetical protein
VAVAAVEAVEDNLSAKAASNESVDGRMSACDDKIGRRTITQQPTNERRRGGGGSATARGRRQLGNGAAAAAARRQPLGSCGGAKADVGGSLAAAKRWRQRDCAMLAAAWRRRCGGGAQRDGGSAVAAARWQQRGGCGGAQRDGGSAVAAARWQQRGGCGGGGSATS